MDKKNAYIVAIISILIVSTAIILVLFFKKDAKTETALPPALNQEIPVEEDKNELSENTAGLVIGQLIKMNEKSIEVLNSEKAESGLNNEESTEIFNISLTNPTTPINYNTHEKKESARLSDLELFQFLEIEYDKKTMDATKIDIIYEINE